MPGHCANIPKDKLIEYRAKGYSLRQIYLVTPGTSVSSIARLVKKYNLADPKKSRAAVKRLAMHKRPKRDIEFSKWFVDLQIAGGYDWHEYREMMAAKDWINLQTQLNRDAYWGARTEMTFQEILLEAMRRKDFGGEDAAENNRKVDEDNGTLEDDERDDSGDGAAEDGYGERRGWLARLGDC